MACEIVLGAGTYCWSAVGMSLESALRDIAELGIKQVDMLAKGHGEPGLFSQAKRRELAGLYESLGLRVSSLLALYEGNPLSGRAKERDAVFAYLVDCLEFCEALGCRQILYKPGDRVIGRSHHDAWQDSVALTRELAPLAREHGVLITFELTPWPFTLVKDCADMVRMLDDVDQDNVFANLDLGHLALVRDGAGQVAAVAERTIHLHLNDNDTFEHTNDPPGSGAAPLALYLDALCENGALQTCQRLELDLVAGIEIETPPNQADAPTPKELHRISRDYSLESLPHIRL
jgi:sugar phosphate isomerase/epimerase